jgi:hypothetical protein
MYLVVQADAAAKTKQGAYSITLRTLPASK